LEVKRALELSPGLPEAHISLGSYHYHANDYGRALDEFGIARKTQPNNTELLTEIGYAQRRQGEPDSALECFKRVVKAKGNRMQRSQNGNLTKSLLDYTYT